MDSVSVIKIGGNVIDSEEDLKQFLSDFAQVKGLKVLVHGGGKLATEFSTKLGIDTLMIDGRRITDSETLKVVTMTYAGWINKLIVSGLNANDCSSVGLCGADAMLYTAVKRSRIPLDYGFVGNVQPESVNIPFLQSLFQLNITPVLAPVSSDKSGQLLNINADTIAQVIAVALSSIYQVKLIYCFEKPGLLRVVSDNSSLIEKITPALSADLIQSGSISGGMIPKITNALDAVRKGVDRVWMGHSSQVLSMVQNVDGSGTCIVR